MLILIEKNHFLLFQVYNKGKNKEVKVIVLGRLVHLNRWQAEKGHKSRRNKKARETECR